MQYRLLSPYDFIGPPNMCKQGKVVRGYVTHTDSKVLNTE